MLIFKQVIAWAGLIALLFGLVMLVVLIALGGGFVLNEFTHVGLMPATALFLGSAGVCSLTIGVVSINDHLREISWTSQEDDDWEWDEEDQDEEEPYKPKMSAVGRNQPCPCGSGKKYKRCCLEQNKLSNAELDDIPF